VSLEQFLENITLEELEELKRLKEQKLNIIPTYSFSQITEENLRDIVELKKLYSNDAFHNWFEDKDITKDETSFLEELLAKYGNFIKSYKEETLKANFIIPIINKVDFLSIELETSSFYEEIISYKADDFILSGSVDFLVSRGLEYSQTPYFFIQEFKKGKVSSDPEPQLLAELIAAVELNGWESIKGAYIVGSIWNFVILERLERHKYQYYVSMNFDSTKIEDLKGIYKNLLYVKNEIIEMIKDEK
jgi:hypothetical protein